MQLLVLSGTGPSLELDSYFTGTLFDPEAAAELQQKFFSFTRAEVSLDRLRVRDQSGQAVPLLRTQEPDEVPHLTTATLESILRNTAAEVELFDLQHVWNRDLDPATTAPDAVLLSTSFIINKYQLAGVLRWITNRFDCPIFLGGQYSNIKYPEILKNHPEVTGVVRGDGEISLGPLVDAIAGRISLADIPNMATVHDGHLKIRPLEYGDMATMESPTYLGDYPVVPYESMRGCPYACKFCSFPAASPKFRWKPAELIRDDWAGYAAHNGTHTIRALDSIFTVPPRRLRQLMALLADAPGPVWEGFSRAGSVKDSDYIDMLTSGRCSQLSIGFESMNDHVLELMNKKVSVEQNRRANQLLKGSSIGCRGHFMVGYPGETPVAFSETADYLATEYAGEFKLSIFSFTDETMPVWQDAEELQILLDPKNPEYGWSHIGMNVSQAQDLHAEAIRRTRWDSDDAVWLFWQREYQTPLVPGNDRWNDLYVQKLVERLAFLPRDVTGSREAKRHLETLLWQLRIQGVELETRRPAASHP